MEVMRLKDENIVIVLFSLIMIVLVRKEVGFLVGGAGLVVKGEVVLG